jgi:hypothetical protein
MFVFSFVVGEAVVELVANLVQACLVRRLELLQLELLWLKLLRQAIPPNS